MHATHERGTCREARSRHERRDRHTIAATPCNGDGPLVGGVQKLRRQDTLGHAEAWGETKAMSPSDKSPARTQTAWTEPRPI